MFGIGLPEMIVIITVALIVVGPDKLPELAKTLAKQMAELKRATNTLKDNLSEEAKSVIPTNEGSGQLLALTSQSAQALPGDQWVNEQQVDILNMHHQKMPSDPDISTISTDTANPS